MENNLQIYNYCEKRWDFYESRDGGYYPSKHDSIVLQEAANKFNITVDEVVKIYGDISSKKANLKLKNMSRKELENELEKIVRNNKETPWGMGLDK